MLVQFPVIFYTEQIYSVFDSTRLSKREGLFTQKNLAYSPKKNKKSQKITKMQNIVECNAFDRRVKTARKKYNGLLQSDLTATSHHMATRHHSTPSQALIYPLLSPSPLYSPPLLITTTIILLEMT